MRYYFYDFEFEENGETIVPISLGMVSEDERELYLINEDYMMDYQRGYIKPKEWLVENVLDHITAEDVSKHGIPRKYWGKIVQDFISNNGRYKSRKEIQLWAYYAAYDHVALAQLWGPMIDLPTPIPMFTHELMQLMEDTSTVINFKPDQEHNALSDAKWNKIVWESCQGNG